MIDTSKHFVAFVLLGSLTSLTSSGCDPEGDEMLDDALYRSLPPVGTTVNLVSVNSGKCLDVVNGSWADGTNVRQWPCNGFDAQAFTIDPAPDGYVILRRAGGDKCLDVAGWSQSPGGNVFQWACHGGANQQWMLEESSDGVAVIRSRHSGLVLDVDSFSQADGANIMQWSGHGGANQRFELIPWGQQPPPPPPPPGGCNAGSLSNVYLSATIVVGPGETFDGCGQRFISNGLGDGSQAEDQKPLFRLEQGATLRNVTLGAPAADGIHLYPDGGSVYLENIVWEDVGEDAMTIKEAGTVTLNGGSARYASDKIFQINAPSTFYLSNFTALDAGKMIRQNGGTTYEVQVFIDNSNIQQMDEVIFRTDSSSSHVTLTNSYYCDLDDGLFRFGSTNVGPGQSHPQATYSNLTGC